MKEYESIEEMIHDAKKKAMYLLEKQDRTQQQLETKLLEQGFPESVVKQAISYVESFHYIDDERYAANYIRYRQEQKSKNQLKLELYKKGIDSDTVSKVLANEYESDERQLIMSLLEKKHYTAESSLKDRNRVISFLLRRGFLLDDIRYCMKIKIEEL